MRTILACTAAASLVLIVASCKKQDDASPSPTANPTATAAYPGYPPGPLPPGQPGQPAPTYNQNVPPQPPPAPPGAPGPVPPPVGASSGPMAVPGPLAFQCQNDVPCGMHHCNMQYGKCAFPCQTNSDCLSPNSCMTGLCVPPYITKPPGSP
jgi:hypothetical protein